MQVPTYAQLYQGDVPPDTGPELAAMRIDSIEQRIANLERQIQQQSMPDEPQRLATEERLSIGLLVIVALIILIFSVAIMYTALNLTPHA